MNTINESNIIVGLNEPILVIPDKPDIERDAVAAEWINLGGVVKRVGAFWRPPNLEIDRIRLYGNNMFCLVLEQKYGLKLVSPPDDILVNIPPKWTKRLIELRYLSDAKNIDYPIFIKPLVPKIFRANIYNNYNELLEECNQLEESTRIIISGIISIKAEIRAFILNGKIMTIAIYEGNADIEEGTVFLNEFIKECSQLLPITYVIDIGYDDTLGWVVIEANSTWGAGLNNCNASAVALCLKYATLVQ